MSKHPAYDATKNLAEARLPSNVQLEKGIEKTEEVLKEEMKARGMRAPEYKLAKDTSKLLETSKEFIEEKNKGNLLQKFVQDSNEAIKELTEQLKSQQFFIDRRQIYLATKQPIQELNEVAKQSAESLKNLALTLVDSSEFRFLITDFVDLVKSILKAEEQKVGSLPSPTPSKSTEVPLTEETKMKAQQTKEVGQKILTDIKEGKIEIPEEKRELFNLRFKQLIQRLNGDPNFLTAVNGLFQLFDQIQYWTTQLKEQAKGTVEQQTQFSKLIENSALWRMWNDGKCFLQNFTGEAILSKLYTDVWNFYQLVMNDEKLTTFFWEFRSFFLSVIRQPDLFDTVEYKEKWNKIYMFAYEWMNDLRYRTLLTTIYDDFNTVLEKFKTDELSQQLARDVTRVAKDIFLDESGKPSLQIMTQGLDNLRSLVAPILRKHLDNVPIPTFSGTDETYDWKVERMFINASTIVPDNVELKVWGDAKVSLTDKNAKAFTYVSMWIRDIGLIAKDISFHFIRKSFPKMDERGVADVTISGKGTTLKIVWKIEGQQNQPWIWSIFQVNCAISGVDVTVKESSHLWLMKFLTSLFSGSIRKNFEDKIECSVIDGLSTINEQLNETVQKIY